MKDRFFATLLVLVAIGLGWDTWFGSGGVTKLFSQKRALTEARLANRITLGEVQDLRREVEALSTSDRAKEKAARTQLGMARGNEIVLFFEEK